MDNALIEINVAFYRLNFSFLRCRQSSQNHIARFDNKILKFISIYPAIKCIVRSETVFGHQSYADDATGNKIYYDTSVICDCRLKRRRFEFRYLIQKALHVGRSTLFRH